jgi:cell division protein FtsI/penicillin-binding protein 2
MAPQKPGLDVEAQSYRTYPDGSLASQVLGFVNDNGQGTYGIEQVLNNQLSGKPGLLKAITDVEGVPLPDNQNNIETAPTAGKNVVLTIDLTLQRQIEQILQAGLKSSGSSSGSVIVMNPNNGAIEAMANYPTYDPSQYYTVTDPTLFDNDSVAQQLEVGSVMKTLTVAAGLDQGVIQPNTTFQDYGAITIDGFTITNALTEPSHTISIQDILRLSLNT